MTERQAAMTSVREFNHRLNGYQKSQQVEWERARWIAFSIFSPFVGKNGPRTAKQWVTFPWEKPDEVKVVHIGTEQEEILNKLYIHFQNRKEKNRS
jgi:hypothetical protein